MPKKGKKPNKASDKPKLSREEEALLKRKKAKERQAFISFVTPLAAVSFFLSLVFFAIGGSKLAILPPAGILSIALSYRYPRSALWFFFFYMPFGGTVVYWLAGGNAVMQLVKDAFFYPALTAIALAYRQKNEPFMAPRDVLPGFWMILGVSILALLLVSLPKEFLPQCDDTTKALGRVCREGRPFFQGLLGLKVFLGYVPLIFCMRALLRDRDDFFFLMRSHVVLAIVCCALSLVQYLMLLTGRCAGTDFLEGDQLFKATLEAKCLVGGALVYSPSQGIIRLPGTFVAPWQWGWFLIGNAYITFAVAFSDPTFLWRTIGMGGMSMVMIGAVISGQRIALALVPVSFVILLVLTGQVFKVKRFLPILIGLVIIGGGAAVMYPDIVQERVMSFQSRWEASPADAMISHQFSFVWPLISDKPLGRGLGTATNSARLFGETALIETWFPKVMYEVGLVGLGFFMIFVTGLTIVGFRAYRSIKDRDLRSFGACFWVFILFISYQTYYYPLDVDPVAVYYWMMMGALVRIPEIERQERAALLLADAADAIDPKDPKPGTGPGGRFRRARGPSDEDPEPTGGEADRGGWRPRPS
jgi:hypothetical protein